MTVKINWYLVCRVYVNKQIYFMYIKRHYGLTPRTMSGLFEDMFQNGWNKWNEEATAYSAPVNIHETDKSYEMQLEAPGVKKEEFKINGEKNILTISYEHKD